MKIYSHTTIERSRLEAATAAFFMSGGKVESIPSFEFKPLPPRIEPQLTQEEIELRDMADQIRTLSATMNKIDIGRTVGLSQNKITDICKRFGVNLQRMSRSRTSNTTSYATSPEDDGKLVIRIKALAEIGVTRMKAADHVGIGYSRMRRLISEYGIEFKAYKRCD